MTNRLQALIPAMLQPTDPAIAGEPSAADGRVAVVMAVTLALVLVALIAVLMGMT